MDNKLIIKIKYFNNNVIELIEKIKEYKLTYPRYVYNVADKIFKVELKNEKDKKYYNSKFKIEEVNKSYNYKIILNDNTIKNHEVEKEIKSQIGVDVEVSKYLYNGIDTGILYINAKKKIKRNKRSIKIKKNKYRITCRSENENNTAITWRKVISNPNKEPASINIKPKPTLAKNEEKKEKEKEKLVDLIPQKQVNKPSESAIKTKEQGEEIKKHIEKKKSGTKQSKNHPYLQNK